MTIDELREANIKRLRSFENEIARINAANEADLE